jgi:predicted metal-binding membrane protein
MRARWAGFASQPEASVAAIIVAAWALLVRDAIVSGLSASHRHLTGSFVASLSGWTIMAIGMMGPAALAGVRHTAVNSLWWRRRRAVAEFSIGYISIWIIFGVVGLPLVALVPTAARWTATGIMLGAAAFWQVTPSKRRWLRDCHRSVPLPPTGWRAEAGAIRFGLRNGLACLGSCWCLMLVMTVVPAAPLFWTAALTVIITAERLLARPRRATRLAALAMGVGAAAIVGFT